MTGHENDKIDKFETFVKFFSKNLSVNMKLAKLVQSSGFRGFLGRVTGPILKTSLPSAKSVLISLELKVTTSAKDAGIH